MNHHPLLDLCARVLEMSEKATEAPWVVVRESAEFGTIGMPVAQSYKDEPLVVGHPLDWGATAEPKVDLDWIAHTRTSAPQIARALTLILPMLEHLRGPHDSHACERPDGPCYECGMLAELDRALAAMEVGS